ncbi:MAG TPA: type IV pilus modification protein PilV [Steroidobacteraceae bacterium]
MKRCIQSFRNPAAGFSLIEVLVALIIVSVGLLGIAKMQALAYSSTGIASKRSLAAIEGSSLASSMSANRAYWAVLTAPATTTVVGTVVTSTDPALAAAPNCLSGGVAPCTPSQVAGYDMNAWANALQKILPNDQATITCANTAGALPVNCVITMTWTENQAAINSQEAQAATAAAAAGTPAAMQLPSYTLYVQP